MPYPSTSSSASLHPTSCHVAQKGSRPFRFQFSERVVGAGNPTTTHKYIPPQKKVIFKRGDNVAENGR